MELFLCFENQTILKLPSSVTEKIKNIKPGEQIGMLKYDENGERKWELLSQTFSESKKIRTPTDSLTQNDKNGFLFLENKNKKKGISMYPSIIHNITRDGNLIDDSLRDRIKQETKKSSTIEDKRRIVGSIYEINSQPFVYYDQVINDFKGPSGSVHKKRQMNPNTSTVQNTNNSNDLTSSTLSVSENTLEALKEKIFKIFEEKGPDGVSMKEIEEKTLKPKHILKKIVDEIAIQTCGGGRRHIWYLKPHYLTK